MSEAGIVRSESPPGGAEGQMTDQDVYIGVCTCVRVCTFSGP